MSRYSSFVIVVQRTTTVAVRYLFSIALLAYALYELHRKPPATLLNPFVLLGGIALLLLPDLPVHLAQGASTVGRALLGLYKAKRSADT